MWIRCYLQFIFCEIALVDFTVGISCCGLHYSFKCLLKCRRAPLILSTSGDNPLYSDTPIYRICDDPVFSRNGASIGACGGDPALIGLEIGTTVRLRKKIEKKVPPLFLFFPLAHHRFKRPDFFLSISPLAVNFVLIILR
jgi:hypothetical protein